MNKKMLDITEKKNVIRIVLSGKINRDDIHPVKNSILDRIRRGTKLVEFHFEDLSKMDVPAMAMIVFVVKYLAGNGITSKVTGLSGECIELVTSLGLDTQTPIEAENRISEPQRKI
ncbi:MAG: STAS domain-containing protein [Pseudomonadota bacterium]